MNAATTLLHFAALSITAPLYYNMLVTAATVTSYVWHDGNEQNRGVAVLDYGLAGLWFLVDTALDWRTVPLNALTFAAFLAMTDHAAWHCVSAAKAAYVTHYLLTG